MNITFKIDAKDFKKNLKKLPNVLVKEVKDVNNAVALDIISDAKQNINDNGSVDRGFLKNKAVYKEVKDNGLSMEIGFDAPYAYVIEFGRKGKKGKKPSGGGNNIDMTKIKKQKIPKKPSSDFGKAIWGWMKRKGIPLQLYYPIARSVYLYDSEPKPFLFPAVRKNVLNLRRRLLMLLK